MTYYFLVFEPDTWRTDLHGRHWVELGKDPKHNYTFADHDYYSEDCYVITYNDHREASWFYP